MNKNSKIYVAGHRGLVGSAIIKKLLSKGFTNLVTRTHRELDLTSTVSVDSFFKLEKPEYVILAAAKVGGIVANNTYRGEFIYENLMIQNNVIHQSYVHNVKKLLFLGSTCIYQKNCPQPMKEEYLLTSELEYTNEPYAIAKIAGIKMCESYNIQYGTNFIAVQPTNLYGPNDNFDLEKSHVLPALLRKMHLGKALEGNDWEAIRKDLENRSIEGVNGSSSEKEILDIFSKYGLRIIGDGEKLAEVEVWGSGKPLREFLWSEDMADACVHLMQNVNFRDIATTKDEIVNTHINIGTGKEISIRNLAETVKKVIGFKGEIVFNSNKPDGTMRKLTDSSKLQELGWSYSVELETGVKQMYHWYQTSN
jgi:GDP-L-fucose synthase